MLRPPGDESVAIPNAVGTGGEIKNLSAGGPLRLRVPVGVASRHHPREVRKAFEAAVAARPKPLPDRATGALVAGHGGNGVDFVLVVWIPGRGIPGYPVIAGERTGGRRPFGAKRASRSPPPYTPFGFPCRCGRFR